MYKQTLLSLAITAMLAGCGGGDKAPSNQSGMVTVTGTPSVGATLTATVEDPDGVVESSIIYAWYANGALIADATGQTYVVTASDIGKEITVIVGYQGNNGVRESQTSAPVAEIPVTVTVAATFIHGLVTGGDCSVFAVTEAGAKGAELASATTANGAVSFGNVEHDGYGLIECSGGTYVDEASGSTLTAPLTRAVVDMSEGGDFVVSPLTEMAVQLAEADAAGLSSALTTYNDLVAEKFGLASIDITTVQPTNLQTTAAANDAAGKYATVIALISQVDENEAGTAADVVDDFATDLSDGELSSTSIQLLAAAEADLPTSSVSANLNQAALDAISVDVGMTNTPGTVAIQGSASVGSTLTGVVTDANGFGTVSYQWSANGVPIDSAIESALILDGSVLGDTITLSVTYTDNSGFSEQATSAGVGPVTTVATNTPGVAGSITGVLTVGQALSVAVPTDANGISGSVTYQWQANGQDIADANAQSYMLSPAEVGAAISVSASYSDDDGFDEEVTSTASGIVYSARVSNQAELATAVAAAASGDLIGLQVGNYTDMAALTVGSGVTLQAISGQVPVISGNTCIELASEAKIDGLTFSALNTVAGSSCAGNGPSSVYMNGNGAQLVNSTFTGEATAAASGNHFVSVKGFQALIERNSFAAKDQAKEGSFISIYANSTANSNEGHTIQYNIFKDSVPVSAGSNNSSGYAIQVGRSTGSDGKEDGLNIIQYNLFSNILTDRRIIKVQSTGNTIHGNTILGSSGMIAFEDGYNNTASSNIIISDGDDTEDGGISFAQLGHTIVDNYINNLRTTSSDRAALHINADPLSGSGNGALLATAGLDFTLTVARNTIVNAQRAIQFKDTDCGLGATILDFDSNLVANQTSGNSINGNTNGSGRTVVYDELFVTAGCALDATSDFDNNHFYSQTLAQSTFNFNGKLNLDGNLFDVQDGATLTAPNANNMVEGSGVDANIGADIDALTFITSDMVGPGSTWTATQP
ncbi:chondroitinase-B domain-containing protein [Simiduia curdlanivorans]|uniref:Chondroitinase-B domain-containing protein n=1 Tax=Simiduia curdlanivorans TaxID=1492769 RepID=A0ABV8V8D7_9GAMM|nr:chondroitinase-B domain-containing protein [Simiduia curdlanivorans]MDN3640742.1 chondroitinase-B domain-containing protein [Simiduia curdlanivorans]